MSVESVTQSVSNLALAFGDDDAEPGAMVCLDLTVAFSMNHSCMCLLVIEKLTQVSISRLLFLV